MESIDRRFHCDAIDISRVKFFGRCAAVSFSLAKTFTAPGRLLYIHDPRPFYVLGFPRIVPVAKIEGGLGVVCGRGKNRTLRSIISCRVDPSPRKTGE